MNWTTEATSYLQQSCTTEKRPADDTLAVVCCYFNPQGYKRLRKNYWTFREHLGNIPLTTVELSFTGRFEIADAIHLQGNEQNVMWQKERLLNIGIQSLPETFKKVAWIDADLIFQNANWYAETIQKLERFPVVQLFERVRDLDADGNEIRTTEGTPYGSAMGLTTWKRPGGAWAARREVLRYGLADEHILGGSDAMMLAAWQGYWRHPLVKRLSRAWKEYHLRYGAKVYPLVRNNIGWVSGDCDHLYHGTIEKRNYVGRWKYLTDYGFDPSEDITIDTNGLWKWNTDKPDMHQAVANYFKERLEDE